MNVRLPLKVRTTREEMVGRRPGSRTASETAGPGTPGHGMPPQGGFWMWPAPHFEHPELARQGSMPSCPTSPGPMGMAYGPARPGYVMFPMVPDSPRGPTPLMGSPIGTPTAMMFPQTPFAQHGGPYATFAGAPGPYHPGPPGGQVAMEPMSPNRGHVGYFHPLFNGFSPFVVGAPMHPNGLPSPSGKSRSSMGGDKNRAYAPSPLKPPTGANRRAHSCTGQNPHAAMAAAAASHAAMADASRRGPQMPPGRAHEEDQDLLAESPTDIQHPSAAHPDHHAKHMQAGKPLAEHVAVTPVAAAPPSAAAISAAAALLQHQQRKAAAAASSSAALTLPSVAEAVASAVASARVSMSGMAASHLNSTRVSMSGGPDLGSAPDPQIVVAAAAAAAAAMQAAQQGQGQAMGGSDEGSGSSAAAAMAAVAAAMEHGVPSGGGMPMYPGMMQSAAAAAAAAMYPVQDLAGLTAASYWQAMPHLQGLLPAAPMSMPVMSAYPMGQQHMGLMHAAMMQQLSAASAMQQQNMVAAAAAMHGLHVPCYMDAGPSDPYLMAAEQLAQLQALQQQGGMQPQSPYGPRGMPMHMPMPMPMGGMAGPHGGMGMHPGALRNNNNNNASAAMNMLPPPPPQQQQQLQQQRQNRRNTTDARAGNDGQARLNARQRRTLRRAKERAIRGLLEAGQTLLARAGDGDDMDSTSCGGSESDDDEAAFGTPDAARSHPTRASADASPLRSGSESDQAAPLGASLAAIKLSGRALAAAGGDGGNASASGASSVCEAVHSQSSGASSANNASSHASPSGARAADMLSPNAGADELHATLVRNLDSLKEKMGPVQQQLDAAAAAAAGPSGGATAAVTAAGLDADLAALIQQMNQKQKDGAVDEKLLRDLQIIQNLIGALKAPTPAPAPPPRQHKGGPSAPMPMVAAGPQAVYLTNKAPGKGFGLVH